MREPITKSAARIEERTIVKERQPYVGREPSTASGNQLGGENHLHGVAAIGRERTISPERQPDSKREPSQKSGSHV